MDSPAEDRPKRRRVFLVIAVLAAASPLVVLALLVDDWSRDLTTNTAATAADHRDETLRPLDRDGDAASIETALTEFCAGASHWELADPHELPASSPLASIAGDAVLVRRLVRTTGLMRYRDDVWVLVELLSDGRVRVHAESRSRVGVGDLGQNPRNLRELLAALRNTAAASM